MEFGSELYLKTLLYVLKATTWTNICIVSGAHKMCQICFSENYEQKLIITLRRVITNHIFHQLFFFCTENANFSGPTVFLLHLRLYFKKF
jgi:hypothetical protein